MIRIAHDLRDLARKLERMASTTAGLAEAAAVDGAKAAMEHFAAVKAGGAGLRENAPSWEARKARNRWGLVPLVATGAYLRSIRRSGSKVVLMGGGHWSGNTLAQLAKYLEKRRPHWAPSRRIAVAAAMKSLRRRLSRVRL